MEAEVDGRQGKRWLFDLRADPTEQKNLIDVSSEKARELEKLLDAHNRDLDPRSFPVLVEAVIPIDRHLASPHLEGEEYQYWPN